MIFKNKSFLFILLFAFILLTVSSVSAYTAVSDPTVDTIGTDTATFHSIAYTDTYSTLYVRFQYRESGTSTWINTASTIQLDYVTAENKPFSYTVNGLTPGTSYDYRSMIYSSDVSSLEIYSASYYSFTTDTVYQAPTVTTQSATSITDTSATFIGTLTSLGDETSTYVSFIYRKDGGSWVNLGSTSTYKQLLTSTGTFSYTISGLTQNSYYEYYAYSYNNLISPSTIPSFYTEVTPSTSINTPTFSTLTYDNLGETYVNLKATLVDPNDWINDTIKIKFYYYQDDTSTSLVPIDTSLQTVSSTGIFNYNLTGLSPSSNHHFTFAYSNDNFVTFDFYNGTLGTFTTLTPTPSALWINTTKVNQTTIGIFSRDLSGLYSNTNYTYRACIDSNNGLVCSNTSTFKTVAKIKPNVTTLNITNIGFNSLTLNGYVNSFGDYSYTNVFFNIYNSTGGSVYSSYTENVSTNQTFSYEITGLNPNSNYTIQAGAFLFSLNDAYRVVGNNVTVSTLIYNPISPTLNNSFPDVIMDYNSNITINLNNYFDNFDHIFISGEYVPLQFGNTWYINENSGKITIVNGTENYYSVLVEKNLEDWTLTIFSYNTTGIIDLTVEATNLYDSINDQFQLSIFIGANTGLIDQKSFFENFAFIKDLFPNFDNNPYINSQFVGFLIIILFLGLGIRFIGKPMNFNNFSIFLIFLVGLLGDFISSWVGYTPFSWFIVPLVLIIIYKLGNILLGGNN